MKTVVLRAQQRWECKSVTAFSEQSVLNAANDAGREGWEPFTAVYYKDLKGSMVWTIFLKRPATGEPAKPSDAAAAHTPEKVPQPLGFDTSGEIFDIKKE